MTIIHHVDLDDNDWTKRVHTLACSTINSDFRIRTSTIDFKNNGINLNSSHGPISLGPNVRAFSDSIEKTLEASRYRNLSGTLLADLIREKSSPSCFIVEIIDECELQCATCIANSRPGTGNARTADLVDRTMRSIASIDDHGIVMISGGEPTLHPDLETILQKTRGKGINNLDTFIITNGIKIADDIEFARLLKEANPNVHVYLQYDSFRDRDLELIRGPINSSLREKAISNLEEVGIKYTLVCVVLKGVNDVIVPEIISRNIKNENLQGITFQPIKLMGRNEFANSENLLSTWELRLQIEDSLSIPLFDHPENPINWSTSINHDGQWQPKPFDGRLYTDIGNHKHISIIWHSSIDNYILESCLCHPIVFSNENTVTALEIHYS